MLKNIKNKKSITTIYLFLFVRKYKIEILNIKKIHFPDY